MTDVRRVRPEEWWVDWAARSASGDRQAMFLAWDGDAVVGIAGTYVEDHGKRWLISMWTDPAARRRRVGRTLADTVVAFALRRGPGSCSSRSQTGTTPHSRSIDRAGSRRPGAASPTPTASGHGS